MFVKIPSMGGLLNQFVDPMKVDSVYQEYEEEHGCFVSCGGHSFRCSLTPEDAVALITDSLRNEPVGMLRYTPCNPAEFPTLTIADN